jgi:MinD superfamily P-loop ATPase
MRELTVISGKGGTGKTSLVAAMATLTPSVVCADCDVDAADLHLLLAPEIEERHDFEGGLTAAIDPDSCSACGTCHELCRFGAVTDADGVFTIDPHLCEGCGVCHDHCPVKCITLEREKAGQWFVSTTRVGPLVHARLGIAQENSGKLVSRVRERAREVAKEQGRNLVLIDGSPGIGCPVIASITGADQVLAVSEPTMSGLHDLKRVLELAAGFRVPVAVCINKYDLNQEMTRNIVEQAEATGAVCVGKIPFDRSVTAAMIAGKTLTEHGPSPATRAVERVWKKVNDLCRPKGERKI